MLGPEGFSDKGNDGDGDGCDDDGDSDAGDGGDETVMMEAVVIEM